MRLFSRALGHPSSLRLDDGLAPGRRRSRRALAPGLLLCLSAAAAAVATERGLPEARG